MMDVAERLRRVIDDFDNDVSAEMELGERADLWEDTDVEVHLLRSALAEIVGLRRHVAALTNSLVERQIYEVTGGSLNLENGSEQEHHGEKATL